MRAKLVGLHKAVKHLSGGRVAIYAYASRGGARLARVEAGSLTAANRLMELELGKPEVAKLLHDARKPVKRTEDRRYIRGLIYAFRNSPEWAKVSKTSQREYSRYLDAFDKTFGDMPVAAFELPAAKPRLLDWRDQWADRPRAADYAMMTVGRLFKWARGRGLSSARPTEDVERLHNADRSDVLWTEEDIARLEAHTSKQVMWAVELAAETGLRLGDLLSLTWGAIGKHGIVWRTSKRKRQVVIPLTPKAKELLDAIPKKEMVVLTNTRGKPWTPDGFKTQFGKAKTAAGITGLHFHDLRGTAATRLFLTGAEKRDIAQVMGWSEAAVDQLLTKYVSSEQVALDLLARMKQKPLTQTDLQTARGVDR